MCNKKMKKFPLFCLTGRCPLKCSWKSFRSSFWRARSKWMTQVNVRDLCKMAFCSTGGGSERFQPLFHPMKWRFSGIPVLFMHLKVLDRTPENTFTLSKTTFLFNEPHFQLVLRAQMTPNTDILIYCALSHINIWTFLATDRCDSFLSSSSPYLPWRSSE